MSSLARQFSAAVTFNLSGRIQIKVLTTMAFLIARQSHLSGCFGFLSQRFWETRLHPSTISCRLYLVLGGQSSLN